MGCQMTFEAEAIHFPFNKSLKEESYHPQQSGNLTKSQAAKPWKTKTYDSVIVDLIAQWVSEWKSLIVFDSLQPCRL